MDKRSLFLALNTIKGMTPRLFWKVVQGLPDPLRIFSMSKSETLKWGLSEEMADRLCKCRPERVIEEQERGIQKLGGRIITHDDPEYPRSLMQIADPPPVLYVLGRIKREDRISLSIVGSRAASTQGRLHAEKLSGELAGMGVTVVSGLAMGIDTWAHKGALRAHGRTLAVLGCGLDIPYPRYNTDVREQIAHRGALISEFPLHTPPLPMNFPRRNRIISGISMGTLVVEAAKRSGSLITARFALEQGREVFAIPGNIQSTRSPGVNSLIQKGAKLVQQVEDIVEEFPLEVQKYLSMAPKKRESTEGRSHRETVVLKLMEREPIHIDDLTWQTTMGSAALSSLLMKMELNGLIRQLPGKRFIRP